VEIIRLGDGTSLTFSQHWRILVAVLGLHAAAFLGLTLLAPNSFWFHRFWIGGVFSLVVGPLVGNRWQQRVGAESDVLSWTKLRGFFLFGAFFCVVTSTPTILEMREGEELLRLVRRLSQVEISMVEWTRGGNSPVQVKSLAEIEGLRQRLAKAELFYPNHEGATESMTLELHDRGRNVDRYSASIPERHLEDLKLGFQGKHCFHHVLIPQGTRWLKSIESARIVSDVPSKDAP
jgi:hypothetical protein